MVLRTAQNCSHGSAFAVDGGTTNCALTRWLIGSFGVPFDLGYVAAPGVSFVGGGANQSRSLAAGGATAAAGAPRVATTHHSSSHQGCQRHTAELTTALTAILPGFTSLKNCDNDTSPRQSVIRHATVMFFTVWLVTTCKKRRCVTRN